MRGVFFLADTNRFRRRPPYVTYALILVNLVCYLAFALISYRSYQKIFDYGLIPKEPTVFAMFTSLFLHAGAGHIAANMALLWIFGRDVEDALGPCWYFAVYLFGGLVANATQMGAVLAAQISETVPILGASGCVAAVCGVFAVRFHYVRIRLQLPTFSGFKTFSTPLEFPAWPIWGAVLCWQIAGATKSLLAPPADTAYWGHLSGFAFGVVVGGAVARGRGGRNEELVARARVSAAHGDLWRAQELYARAIEAMGEDPELLLEAAEVQERLGEEEAAQDMYTRAVEAIVNQVPGRNTAQLLKRLASHGHLSRLVPALRFRVAGILEQSNPEAAVGVLMSLVDGDHHYEDRALALYKVARLQQAMGQEEAAVASYKRLIAEFPDSQWTAPAREELCRLSKHSA